jgi:hypothetical protein
MRQVRIRMLAGPKSPMRYFKERTEHGPTWTFNEVTGTLFNEPDAVEEVERLRSEGFPTAEICNA